MALTTDSTLDFRADARFDALVDGIEARPGEFVRKPELEELTSGSSCADRPRRCRSD